MPENLPTPDWDLKLLATDISTKALKRAHQGAYQQKQITF